MTERTIKSVTDSLEADNRMLPYLPYLLQDLWSMGCSLDQIISVVGTLMFPSENVNALDLGCGKGAVAINIAFKYGFNVTGIDAMQEFLDEANLKASEYNVSHLCSFINEDIYDFIKVNRDYDLVVFASLGGILGSTTETVGKLRTQVKPGGYIIVDDAYLKSESIPKRKGYEYCLSYSETKNALTAFGDVIVQQINTTGVNEKINQEYLTLIKNHATELITMNPELEKFVTAYVDNQAVECSFINNYLEGALWIVQKREIHYLNKIIFFVIVLFLVESL
ncbi:MAG: class I SAM-dependent methyltransferase [Melioribacteraceae bacterium]|nr:MAG: class I SAM-dependent methyltransferase [Melioribacteraceae bacterium]